MSDNLDSEGRYWRIEKWFPELSKEVVAQLRAYHAELIFFNGRMNLISPRTEKTADLLHVADGIVGGRAVLNASSSKEIFDIGSGNGVPGIIMAALAPERKFVLVDADARKVEFLKHCIARATLKNCQAVHARLEDLPENSITCAVTRGVASLSKVLIMCRRAASSNCEFFHFKGRSWATEVAEIPSQLLASWDPVLVSDYMLPEGDANLSIILTKRIQV